MKMHPSIDDNRIGNTPGGVVLHSLQERVAGHPMLGTKCRFDAQGRAYAEIDGRRLGSLASDILEMPGSALDRDITASRDEKGTLDLPQPSNRPFAQRAYHAVIGTAVPRDLREAGALPETHDATSPGRSGVGDREVPAHEGDVTEPHAESVAVSTLLDSLDDAPLIDADRVLRAIHAINFFSASRSSLLFLPVHDRLLKSIRYDHGKHFAQLLISLGLSPARVVIEIPPASSAHRTFLAYLLRSYRSYGFKVAAHLEDAGKVLSFDSTAMPDFVVAQANTAQRDGVVRPLVRFGALSKVGVVFVGVPDAEAHERLTAMGARYIESRL